MTRVVGSAGIISEKILMQSSNKGTNSNNSRETNIVASISLPKDQLLHSQANKTSTISAAIPKQAPNSTQMPKQSTSSSIKSPPESNQSSTQFDPAILDAEVCKSMPEGYVMRPLSFGDFEKGFLDCLAELTQVGPVTQQEFTSKF